MTQNLSEVKTIPSSPTGLVFMLRFSKKPSTNVTEHRVWSKVIDWVQGEARVAHIFLNFPCTVSFCWVKDKIPPRWGSSGYNGDNEHFSFILLLFCRNVVGAIASSLPYEKECWLMWLFSGEKKGWKIRKEGNTTSDTLSSLFKGLNMSKW